MAHSNLPPLILASASPRRQQLLEQAGFTFSVKKTDVEEDFPDDLPVDEVAEHLAVRKAHSFTGLAGNEIVIAADTTVVLGKEILNKPFDRDDAIRMLQRLSGNTHTVITGVCLRSKDKSVSFSDKTLVVFKPLTLQEIEYYVDHYNPYDKAGAYGIQDWIGMIAITRLEGSYFNVVGLPVNRVYEFLMNW
jgi:septum formation protein